MKKILGIVVIGLLCFNTTFAADNIKPKKINEKTFRDNSSGL